MMAEERARKPRITFDHRGGESLLAALEPGGWAHSLVDFAKKGQLALDLQLRGYSTRSSEKWVTLYMGMEKVLDFRSKGGKSFRLGPHSKLGTSAYGWRSAWSQWQSPGKLAAEWSDVDLYLERAIPRIPTSALVEGAVQAAVSRHEDDQMVAIDRESQLAYVDTAEKRKVHSRLQKPLLSAMEPLTRKGWRRSVPTSLGGECDVLAIDRAGRLVTIEVKPWKSMSTIQWAPLQARHYANLFNEWVSGENGVGDTEAKCVLDGMVDQRKRIGLIRNVKHVNVPIGIQPMIAIGRGVPEMAIDRMREVQRLLEEAGLNEPPLEVKSVTMWSELEDIDKKKRSGRERQEM